MTEIFAKSLWLQPVFIASWQLHSFFIYLAVVSSHFPSSLRITKWGPFHLGGIWSWGFLDTARSWWEGIALGYHIPWELSWFLLPGEHTRVVPFKGIKVRVPTLISSPCNSIWVTQFQPHSEGSSFPFNFSYRGLDIRPHLGIQMWQNPAILRKLLSYLPVLG